VVLLLTSNVTFAKDIPVKVVPTQKISTSNVDLQEGDDISFAVANDVFVGDRLYISKGATVTGLITKIVHNDFTCEEASIYAENFKVRSIDGKLVKLGGIVYKKGRTHFMFTQFIPEDLTNGFIFIRGGEAQIKPEKDSFILYVEGKPNEDL